MRRLDTRFPWLFPTVLILLSCFVLGFVWVSEFFGEYFRFFGNGNLAPCHLCIVQRYPYGLILILAIASILVSNRAFVRTFLLSLIALVLIFGTYVASFHTGVEYGWWTAGSSCSTQLTLLDLTQPLTIPAQSPTHLPPPNCSDAAWRFPGSRGLSMAGYNTLLSSGLAMVTAALVFANLKACRV